MDVALKLYISPTRAFILFTHTNENIFCLIFMTFIILLLFYYFVQTFGFTPMMKSFFFSPLFITLKKNKWATIRFWHFPSVWFFSSSLSKTELVLLLLLLLYISLSWILEENTKYTVNVIDILSDELEYILG